MANWYPIPGLQQHLQASTHRVDLLLLVKVHRFFLRALRILLVFLLDLLDLGLKPLHGSHRLVALASQGPDQDLNKYGENDDAYPVIGYYASQRFQSPQDEFRYRLYDAVYTGYSRSPIHGTLQSWIDLAHQDVIQRTYVNPYRGCRTAVSHFRNKQRLPLLFRIERCAGFHNWPFLRRDTVPIYYQLPVPMCRDKPRRGDKVCL